MAGEGAGDIDLEQIDRAQPQCEESGAEVNVQVHSFVTIGVRDAQSVDGLRPDPPETEVVERDGPVDALLKFAAKDALPEPPIHECWGEGYEQPKHDEKDAEAQERLLELRSRFGGCLGHRNATNAARGR